MSHIHEQDKEEKLTKGHQGPAIIYVQWPYRGSFQPRFGDTVELGTPLRIRYFEIIILLTPGSTIKVPNLSTYLQSYICTHIYVHTIVYIYAFIHR